MKFSEFLQSSKEGGVTWTGFSLVNIEGGTLEIATRAFDRLCYTTPSAGVVAPDCDDNCGRQRGNYVQIASGEGDSVYSVLALTVSDEPVGCAVVFDSPWTSAAPLWGRLTVDNRALGDASDCEATLHDFDDSSAYTFGGLRSDGFLALGDSVMEDSANAIVIFRGLPRADYSVFAFCEPYGRSEDVEIPGFASLKKDPEQRAQEVDIIQEAFGVGGSYDPLAPRPRVVVALHNDLARSTGLADGAKEFSVEDYFVTHKTSTVMSNVRPRHLEAIWTNAEFLGAQGHRDEALSYLLQAAWLGDVEAIPQLLRNADLVRGRERELLARRLINAEWSLPTAADQSNPASLSKKNPRGGL